MGSTLQFNSQSENSEFLLSAGLDETELEREPESEEPEAERPDPDEPDDEDESEEEEETALNLSCPQGQVLVGYNLTGPLCSPLQTQLFRFPTDRAYTGDEICSSHNAGTCVSQGFGDYNYLFCGTQQSDISGVSAGAQCLSPKPLSSGAVATVRCPEGQVMVGVADGQALCAIPKTSFYRFPTDGFYTGDQVCERHNAGSCVSQGSGSSNYLFCGTMQVDYTGYSAGVHCLKFEAETSPSGSVACPPDEVMTGMKNSRPVCLKPRTRFYRFPTSGYHTGDEVCRLNGAGPCLSQGNGEYNYLFCGTVQTDPTGLSAGVTCLVLE